MTLPDERTRAVINTQDFLRRLLDPKQTPRIPKKIRKEAYWCLRHYPWTLYLEQSAKKLPDIWGMPETKK